MTFFVNLDLTPLQKVLDADAKIREEAEKAGKQLVAMTRAHIVEEASRKLRSRRQMYVDSLTHFQVDENTFVVNLDAKARWIEEGLPEHNMLDDLLSSHSAKTAQDGSKYVVVPFQHNVGPSTITPAQANLLATIKMELRKAKIPYGKIEKDENGDPKLGLLHRLNISTPLKTKEGVGQGHGPIGDPIQGWSADGASGTPVLKGARVYQQKVKDKAGKDKIQRTIMTYRVASSKHHEDPGRWDHPGLEATNLMDEGGDWAQDQWDRVIAPSILDSLVSSLG